MRQIGTNEATRYELIAEDQRTGRKVLIGYTPRKNRAGALSMLVGNLEPDEMRIDRLARATGTTVSSWQTQRGVIAASGTWVVKFSGRTQRDVRNTTGELADTIYNGRYDA